MYPRQLQNAVKKNESIFGSVYTFENCEEFFDSNTNTSDLREDLILSSQITPILAEGLNGNPRQCKRFLNMFMMRMKMAEDKKLNIEKRILSKLMLLEYFRTETFKTIFNLQSSQEGKPSAIKFIEEEIKITSDEEQGSKKSQEGIESSVNIDLWSKDEWLIKWFSMEPQLSDVDLRPYFYLSRDKISSISSESLRMSPKVEELLKKLTSKSDVLKKQALEIAHTLNPIDANNILKILIKNVYNTEDDETRENLLKSVNMFCEIRKELLSDLFTFYNKIPEKHLSQAVIPQIQLAVKGTSFVENQNELLEKWSKNQDNKLLANISQKTLKKK